jgi:hypothetical protein
MTSRARAAVFCSLVLVAVSSAAAQTPPPKRAATIDPFDLGASPLALSGAARPNAYLAAVGRRSIAMGTEDGRFELWSWPVKWAHDFQLAFRVPKYTTPIPARDVARSVMVRPEGGDDPLRLRDVHRAAACLRAAR